MTVARYFGFNPPFLGGTQTVLSRQEDLRLIKNDILQLLFTLPGERIHRPTFGTELRAAPFAQFDDAFLARLRNDILRTIATEEPRITNTDVVIEKDVDQLLIRVTVTGQLSFDPNVKFELETSIDSSGAS